MSLAPSYMKHLIGISSWNPVPEPADEAFIDMPGMIMADRSYQTLTLDELSVTVPSQDFPLFHERLLHAKEEIISDGCSVIKLRGWLSGIVMTPEHRRQLLSSMEEMLPAVKRLAASEDEEFTRRIDGVNKTSPTKVVTWRAEKTKSEQKDGQEKEKPN